MGGDGPAAMKLATTLYGTAVVGTVPVSSTATAEAVKLTENIFRAVNIALVNELKQIYAAMDVDVWEVIEDMRPYISRHLAEGGRLHDVARHMLGLFAGRPGARGWRRALSEGKRGAGLETLDAAVALVAPGIGQAA